MPKNEHIIFQTAIHYLPKIALHFEYLCETIQQACIETHPVIHHAALKNILEIIQFVEKPELKSRFLKELMRIEHLLNRNNSLVTQELSEQLHSQIQQLSQLIGRFGGNIHKDAFLQSVGMAQSINNQACENYSPQLLLWLESEPSYRQENLCVWLAALNVLQTTVDVYLTILRVSARFQPIQLLQGFYQRPLTMHSCHLILLRMEKSYGIIPRMQLGHHGISIRLCDGLTLKEIKETEATLDIAICQL